MVNQNLLLAELIAESEFEIVFTCGSRFSITEDVENKYCAYLAFIVYC